MTALTPLEQALVAFTRQRDPNDRQPQFDDAATLGECGVFSNRNIAHITGLSAEAVLKITGKSDKTGGRLNPESLPFLQDAAVHWARRHAVSIPDIQAAIKLGTSWGCASLLTGIPRSSLYSKARWW